MSGGDAPIATVPAQPALVVATSGVEPLADGGYGAVLLLDTWALLGRSDLRATEDALRRWYAAATLARPGAAGGHVVIVAESGLGAVQSLVRWDPAGAADRELGERTELGLPPAVRLAELTGSRTDVAELLDLAELPQAAEVLGPVPTAGTAADTAGDTAADTATGVAEPERMLVRVPRHDGAALASALRTATAVRSARHSGALVRVRLDPVDLG
jgi:primosomal protein N' (replication factor Y)